MVSGTGRALKSVPTGRALADWGPLMGLTAVLRQFTFQKDKEPWQARTVRRFCCWSVTVPPLPASRDQCNSHWSNPMKLRRNEFCPIHRSLFCCGRERALKDRRFQLGVQRIDDPHHPRGYRELRSPAEMRKLLNRKIAEQEGKCPICMSGFTDYNEIVPDHIEPKGMGGAWRDDHPENIQAVHRRCNLQKGSRRLGG
jgi:HNH endonuclease